MGTLIAGRPGYKLLYPLILRGREAISDVILRCELLRASKDGVQRSACGPPSRLAKGRAPQDDVRVSATTTIDMTTRRAVYPAF